MERKASPAEKHSDHERYFLIFAVASLAGVQLMANCHCAYFREVQMNSRNTQRISEMKCDHLDSLKNVINIVISVHLPAQMHSFFCFLICRAKEKPTSKLSNFVPVTEDLLAFTSGFVYIAI